MSGAILHHTIAGVFEGYADLPHGRKRVWYVPANAAVWVEAQEARLGRDNTGTVDVDGYTYVVRAVREGTEIVERRTLATWRVEFQDGTDQEAPR